MREDEPTSPKSYDMTKDEILKTILEIAPWGDKHEELKIEEVTPCPKWKSSLFNCVRKWKPLL